MLFDYIINLHIELWDFRMARMQDYPGLTDNQSKLPSI